MKNQISWVTSLNTGVGIIDQDHKGLFRTLNLLNLAMIEGQSKELINRIIQELIEYIIEHFGHEEQLMEQYKYADSRAHIDEHMKLIARVTASTADIENGRNAVPLVLLEFLYNWLNSHIMKSDKKLAQALLAAGFI